MLSLKLLLYNKYQAYDDFLLQKEYGWLYYSSKYKLFLESLLNAKSEYWIVEDADKIVGVLPLMFFEGKYEVVVNTLPFYGSNGGILTDRDDVYDVLLQKYKEVIERKEVSSSNYISNPLLKPEDKNIPHHIIDERISQLTPINYTVGIEDALINSFHYKVRNTIRKSLKEVSKIEINNNYFQFLEETHRENMIAIGGKPKSNLFFQLIPKFFVANKDYKIYTAFNERGEIMSAVLLFYFNNTVEYFTPVIKQEYRSSQPLTALIYRAMIDAASQGYKWWNWGATWKSQKGVYLFKSRWNTKDILYKYYTYLKKPEIYYSSSEELLLEYPDFYVIPFDKLKLCQDQKQ